MIKKKPFIIIAFVLAIALIYCAYYYYDNDSQIVTIYPSNEPAKVKPQNIEDIVSQKVESTIYENLHSKGRVNKTINIKNELEEPINIIKNTSNEQLVDPISDIITNILEPKQQSGEVLNVFEFQANNSKTDERPNGLQGLNVIHIRVNDNSNKIENKKSIRLSTSRYKVQLGAVKSESDGYIEWERIKAKNPKIFSDSTVILKKVPYENGKFFYLIFENKDRNLNQAKIICKKLSNTGQNCIVAKYKD